MQKQNARLELLVIGLRDGTLAFGEGDPQYMAMCAAIDEYRLAGNGVGEADFPSVLNAIADLIQAHLGDDQLSQEDVEELTPEERNEYERMEERLQKVFRHNDGMLFHLALGPLQVGIVHGSLRLCSTHPGIKELSPDYHLASRQLRDACLEFYREMGFTDEEVEYLDTEETLT